MVRLAANLSTMFGEVSFLSRFERAAMHGFRAVECQFPYEYAASEIVEQLSDNDLRMVLINAPSGSWAKGERGLAALPGREDEFRSSMALAIDYATDLGCAQVHVMAGVAAPGMNPDAMAHTFVDNLRYAAQFAAMSNVAVLIEPISKEAMPGYFLSGIEQAADLIDEAGVDNLYLQYDLYHRSFAGPELIGTYQAYAELIRHVQIAGWPGRHEPDNGDLAWRETLEELDVLGYDGFVGCEYRPAARTEAGLGWARQWLGPMR